MNSWPKDTAYFFTESCFVLQWARTSDRIGRRPVLLCGVAGISLSAMCFGLSSTFPGLVMSRALAGVLNANFAVLRGAMADILDSSNFARGIAWMPIMWSIGATVGSVWVFNSSSVRFDSNSVSFRPLVGGSLSHPYERMPGIFGGNVLWKTHPYLLPCLFSATVSISAFVLASLFLEEVIFLSTCFGLTTHYCYLRPYPPIRSAHRAILATSLLTHPRTPQSLGLQLVPPLYALCLPRLSLSFLSTTLYFPS